MWVSSSYPGKERLRQLAHQIIPPQEPEEDFQNITASQNNSQFPSQAVTPAPLRPFDFNMDNKIRVDSDFVYSPDLPADTLEDQNFTNTDDPKLHIDNNNLGDAIKQFHGLSPTLALPNVLSDPRGEREQEADQEPKPHKTAFNGYHSPDELDFGDFENEKKYQMTDIEMVDGELEQRNILSPKPIIAITENDELHPEKEEGEQVRINSAWIKDTQLMEEESELYHAPIPPSDKDGKITGSSEQKLHHETEEQNRIFEEPTQMMAEETEGMSFKYQENPEDDIQIIQEDNGALQKSAEDINRDEDKTAWMSKHGRANSKIMKRRSKMEKKQNIIPSFIADSAGSTNKERDIVDLSKHDGVNTIEPQALESEDDVANSQLLQALNETIQPARSNHIIENEILGPDKEPPLSPMEHYNPIPSLYPATPSLYSETAQNSSSSENHNKITKETNAHGASAVVSSRASQGVASVQLSEEDNEGLPPSDNDIVSSGSQSNKGGKTSVSVKATRPALSLQPSLESSDRNKAAESTTSSLRATFSNLPPASLIPTPQVEEPSPRISLSLEEEADHRSRQPSKPVTATTYEEVEKPPRDQDLEQKRTKTPPLVNMHIATVIEHSPSPSKANRKTVGLRIRKQNKKSKAGAAAAALTGNEEVASPKNKPIAQLLDNESPPSPAFSSKVKRRLDNSRDVPFGVTDNILSPARAVMLTRAKMRRLEKGNDKNSRPIYETDADDADSGSWVGLESEDSSSPFNRKRSRQKQTPPKPGGTDLYISPNVIVDDKSYGSSIVWYDEGLQFSEPLIDRLKDENRKRIFKGFLFVFTGLNKLDVEKSQKLGKSDSLVEQLQFLIECFGGKVASEFYPPDHTRVAHKDHPNFPKSILLAQSPSKTIKYLKAIAYCTPILHYSWVISCLEKDKLLSIKKFMLPMGLDVKTKKALYMPFDPTGERDNIFEGQKVEVLSTQKEIKEQWSSLLQATGARIVTSLTYFHKRSDIILISELNPDKLWLEQSGRDEKGRPLTKRKRSKVDKYLDTPLKMIPMVTTEWVFQSLIHRKKLPVDYDPSFLDLQIAV